MFKCARPGCTNPSNSSCSGCGRESYCSGDCQKQDWKAHKSMCPILKKLSNKLQPFHVVAPIITEILVKIMELGDTKKGSNIRILEHLLSYSEYQFGEEVPGVDYRERENGERFHNWELDLTITHFINKTLADQYCQDDSPSNVIRDNKRLFYLKRSYSIQKAWLNHIDSDPNKANHPIDRADAILKQLCDIEESFAVLSMNRTQHDTANGHCQQFLAYAKRLKAKGEQNTTYLFRSLSILSNLREHQVRYSEAVTFAEEAYNLVVETYDCVHPQVQEAAGILINILIVSGNLFDAERYAEVTYGNLRDKKNGMDQKSEAIAHGAFNLAYVFYRQNTDQAKAELHARECLRIRGQLYTGDHDKFAMIYNLLARILQAQNKLTKETEDFFKRALAISLRNEGPDTSNIMSGKVLIGKFYCQLALIQPTLDLKRKQFVQAQLSFRDSHRISSKILGSTHSNTIDIESMLENVARELA